MTERDALITLAYGCEPGDRAVGDRIARVGAEQALAEIVDGCSPLHSAAAIAARIAVVDFEAERDRAGRSGVRIITRSDAQWPTQLNDLDAGAPLALWVHGAADLRLLALQSIAIVGARAATGYGVECAHEFAADLAGHGWTVVSGGAFGIDAAAHRGALAVDGTTMCVLACGVDIAYPSAHLPLFDRISNAGLLISESPLGHGVRRQRFLTRNRIIAALSRATVVVEAAARSGSRSTATWAESLARIVVAVPGPITSAMSVGSHDLIRDGKALLVSSAADVRELLGAPISPQQQPTRAHDELAEREQRVLDVLPRGRSTAVSVIAREAGMSEQEVLPALGLLELTGFAEVRDGHWRASGVVA